MGSLYFARVLLVFVLIEYNLALDLTTDGPQLLRNGGFEEESAGPWRCKSCTLLKSDDAVKGKYAGHVTDRSGSSSWLYYKNITGLEKGKTYYLSTWLKVLNLPSNNMFTTAKMVAVTKYSDGNTKWSNLAFLPQMRPDRGWQKAGGDITFPDGTDVIGLDIEFRFDVTEADYLVDDVSFTEVLLDPTWETLANQRIDQLRKSDVTLKVTIRDAWTPSLVQIKTQLRRHDFPFGSAVSTSLLNSNTDRAKKYKQFFSENFEMAVIENALKWKSLERNKGQPKYESGDAAIAILQQHGYPVRGHCVFWARKNGLPPWFTAMDNVTEIKAEIDTRLQRDVPHYQNKLVHWDVDNELLHEAWMEARTGDPDLVDYLFNQTHALDPHAKLFLNDFGVVSQGTYATAYVSQARRLVSHGVPVYGMGIQSHLSGMPNMVQVAKRLSVLGSAGLPLWITELDINLPEDANQKAKAYENVLRMYYSYAPIEGVMLWGFWNESHWIPAAAIVEGENFQLNAAGEKWQYLMREEWNTKSTLNPSTQTEEFHIRAFQGKYEAHIFYNGTYVATQEYDVPKGESVTINLNI